MEKLLIFSLSLFLFTACHEEPNNILTEVVSWSDEERKELADSLYKNSRYYQGHSQRQALFDTLMLIDPKNESFPRQKSITHTKAGDYHIAIPLLEKSYKIDKSESLYYYSWVSLFYYRDYAKALRLLNEYDDLTPNVRDYTMGMNVNYQKGLCLKELDRFDEAIEEFTKCIDEEKIFVDLYAFVYRGICHQQEKNHQKAIIDFDKALSKDANCSMAHFYKAISLRKLNKERQAVVSMKKAQSMVNLGHKKSDSYVEVFDAIHPILIKEFLGDD